MNDRGKTIIGLVGSGFFVALPVLLAGMVLQKFFHLIKGVVHPLMDTFPGAVFREPAARFIVVCVAIVGLLWLVGAVARTGRGKQVGRWIEAGLLNRLPLYTFFRNLASGLAGKEGEGALRPVLVTVNPGMQQLGLIVERHADGNATVFIPSSPNPGSGSVVVVEAALLRELHVPAHRVFQCLSGWGYGAMALKTGAGGEANPGPR